MRILALLLALIAGPLMAQERPSVAVSTYPLAYMAERLGGGEVDVIFPIPEGIDPAFWRPGIRDIAAMQGADLIALNGASFEDWATKASLPRSRLVDTTAGFSDAFIATETVTHSHGDGGEHSHTGTATYTWLDFDQAALQAEALAGAMVRRIPALEEGMEDRLLAVTEELAELDALAEQAGATLADRTIIASHPRYQYFARAYGVTIEALEWEPGAMPSEDQWAEVAAMADGAADLLLMWEAAPPQEALDRAAELGFDSIVFDPMANTPPGGEGFVEGMRATLRALGDVAGG
ncbi:MAG: metal ABC transporter substrate-binding protein [Shimia sp.]